MIEALQWTCTLVQHAALLLPAQHEFRVLAVDIFLHQLQQQSSHDVSVVFQFAVQGHGQQGGKVHLGPGVEVITALQGADKLQTQNKITAQKNREMAKAKLIKQKKTQSHKQVQHKNAFK